MEPITPPKKRSTAAGQGINSILAEWYFRLGSTNSKVNEYQFNNLPCPVFHETATAEETATGAAVAKQLAAGKPDKAFALLQPLLAAAPFSPVVRDAVVAAVDRIVAIERNPGEMARADRSALATAAEIATLLVRYEQMKKVK